MTDRHENDRSAGSAAHQGHPSNRQGGREDPHRDGEGRHFARAGRLRLGVQGGGCSGLSYNIRFDTQPRERDRIFQFDDVRVFVDPKSFIYLHGMTLDYQETLMQQGFVFVNPNSSKSCGCGTSFSA